MLKKSRIYLRAGLALLALWAVVVLALCAVERQRPSEQKALQFLEAPRLRSDLSPEDRRAFISQLAAQLGALEGDDRQRVLMGSRIRPVVAQMTDDERALFLQLASAGGLAESMDGFDTAPPERRRRWLNQALNELEQLHGDGRAELLQQIDETTARRIAEYGLPAYWREADLTTRIELLPLLERIQGILQVPR